MPDVATLDAKALALSALAALLLLRLKLGIAATLAISAGVALAWFVLSGTY
jgi:chromate transporter